MKRSVLISILILVTLLSGLITGVVAFGWGAKAMAKKQETLMDEEKSFRGSGVAVEAAIYFHNKGKFIHMDEYDIPSLSAEDTIVIIIDDQMLDLVVQQNWNVSE